MSTPRPPAPPYKTTRVEGHRYRPGSWRTVEADFAEAVLPLWAAAWTAAWAAAKDRAWQAAAASSGEDAQATEGKGS